ncbi:MAG: hypothetical protein VB957_01400 [Pseudomonadales bacterium]|jgi:Tfp pilus assembly pilus retraction ATPase PilT
MSLIDTKAPRIISVLKQAVENKATDVHIVSGLPVMYRIGGELIPLNDIVEPAGYAKALLFIFVR